MIVGGGKRREGGKQRAGFSDIKNDGDGDGDDERRKWIHKGNPTGGSPSGMWYM